MRIFMIHDGNTCCVKPTHVRSIVATCRQQVELKRAAAAKRSSVTYGCTEVISSKRPLPEFQRSASVRKPACMWKKSLQNLIRSSSVYGTALGCAVVAAALCSAACAQSPVAGCPCQTDQSAARLNTVAPLPFGEVRSGAWRVDPQGNVGVIDVFSADSMPQPGRFRRIDDNPTPAQNAIDRNTQRTQKSLSQHRDPAVGESTSTFGLSARIELDGGRPWSILPGESSIGTGSGGTILSGGSHLAPGAATGSATGGLGGSGSSISGGSAMRPWSPSQAGGGSGTGGGGSGSSSRFGNRELSSVPDVPANPPFDPPIHELPVGDPPITAPEPSPPIPIPLKPPVTPEPPVVSGPPPLRPPPADEPAPDPIPGDDPSPKTPPTTDPIPPVPEDCPPEAVEVVIDPVDESFCIPPPPEVCIPVAEPEFQRDEWTAPHEAPVDGHAAGDAPVVPEPGSLLLLVIGGTLGGAAWMRRRKSPPENAEENPPR